MSDAFPLVALERRLLRTEHGLDGSLVGERYGRLGPLGSEEVALD